MEAPNYELVEGIALNDGVNDDEREFSVYSFDSADYEEGPINEANIPDVGTCIPSGCRKKLQSGSKR